MKQPERSWIIRVLRAITPFKLRVFLRSVHQYFVWKLAVQRFRKEYEKIENLPKLVDDLVYGWGNMGWSAYQDFTVGIVKAARENSGNVLECGSGLSTVLLGIVAQSQGFRVYTLEHEEKWISRVRSVLDDLGIDSVNISLSPLVDYGTFEWYSIPPSFPETFSLVICDGPPHYVRGGRYGLLPIIVNRLSDSSIVLLDDYSRDQEREIVERWSAEFGLKLEIRGEGDVYARISGLRGNSRD